MGSPATTGSSGLIASAFCPKGTAGAVVVAAVGKIDTGPSAVLAVAIVAGLELSDSIVFWDCSLPKIKTGTLGADAVVTHNEAVVTATVDDDEDTVASDEAVVAAVTVDGTSARLANNLRMRSCRASKEYDAGLPSVSI